MEDKQKNQTTNEDKTKDTELKNENTKKESIHNTEEEKHIIETAFGTQGHEGLADIGPKTSRKKDIAPAIEQVVIKG